MVLILGTGIAGLSAALKLAKFGKVVLVCKDEALEGASRYAQGGIASVWSAGDSFEEHTRDTLSAGAGLCKEEVVDLCVREGPARIRELIELGVAFTRTNDQHPDAYDLHREGGHGKRRILHADDLTGWAIVSALYERVKENPNIEILTHHMAVDLITDAKALNPRKAKSGNRCLGAYLLDTQQGKIFAQAADVTLLAAGGAGKIYLYTSNPDTATGDGIAMAHRAGARVANLEFMQFHPTCLYHPNAKNFLISEALRGEGAVLRRCDGYEFMKDHHPLGSLAPRDIVARAIDIEMKRTGEKYVHLDATSIPSNSLKFKFPNIYDTCLRFGIDITSQPIPVVPAAHYTCGGVLVDTDGQSTLENLYAIGEVACTGLHGANRLASNSLLEAVVFADRTAQSAARKLGYSNSPDSPRLPQWDSGTAVPLEESIDIAANWLEIRTLMWNYVGIVRSDRRLERARRRLEILKTEVNQYYWGYLLTRDLVELRNLLHVADLTVQCASLRKESRGLHYTVDYPETRDEFYRRDTVL